MQTSGKPAERRVDTAKGQIFVREIPGEGPPIVLMHGFPDDHRIYDKLLPRLSPRRAVALGYGRSDRPGEAGFSAEDHAAELTAVLDELDIDRAVLVGHDASGPDAVHYTLTYPDRVANLVLLNTLFGHRYLNPSLAAELSELFKAPFLHLLPDAGHYPQHDRPETVADLLKQP